MGREINRDTFSRTDHQQFCQQLNEQLQELEARLAQPGFSTGPATLGAEVELYIVDDTYCPAALNETLLDSMAHPLLTEELNRFNLEVNLSPVPAAGAPFQAMGQELNQVLEKLRAHASKHEADIVTTGILPTLNRSHLEPSFMTDRPRYRALANGLTGSKKSAFSVDINGVDSLKMLSDELTLEGANTSFQVHLKVPAERFADYYNAAQLITPLALAVAGNSPTFLGKRLWQETRIALFKQSIDDRHPATKNWRHPARVCFGHGWVRNSAWELFAENVALYAPLIPYTFEQGPPFAELNLHHGTVWSWNRAVFDAGKDEHLRIEFRALPSGPTVMDMMANAALLTGLTAAYADHMQSLLPALPFNYAEYNFYRAAKDGLSAHILWPQTRQHGVHETPVRKVLADALNEAASGLRMLDVASDEISSMMSIIEDRLATGQTGAAWQLHQLQKYGGYDGEPETLRRMLVAYMDNAQQGQPVAQWGG